MTVNDAHRIFWDGYMPFVGHAQYNMEEADRCCRLAYEAVKIQFGDEVKLGSLVKKDPSLALNSETENAWKIFQAAINNIKRRW